MARRVNTRFVIVLSATLGVLGSGGAYYMIHRHLQQQDPAYGIVVRVGRVLIFRPAARGRSKNYAVAGAGLVAASTADFLPASH